MATDQAEERWCLPEEDPPATTPAVLDGLALLDESDDLAFLAPSSYSLPTCLSMAVTSSTTLFMTALAARGSTVLSQSLASTDLRSI